MLKELIGSLRGKGANEDGVAQENGVWVRDPYWQAVQDDWAVLRKEESKIDQMAGTEMERDAFIEAARRLPLFLNLLPDTDQPRQGWQKGELTWRLQRANQALRLSSAAPPPTKSGDPADFRTAARWRTAVWSAGLLHGLERFLIQGPEGPHPDPQTFQRLEWETDDWVHVEKGELNAFRQELASHRHEAAEDQVFWLATQILPAHRIKEIQALGRTTTDQFYDALQLRGGLTTNPVRDYVTQAQVSLETQETRKAAELGTATEAGTQADQAREKVKEALTTLLNEKRWALNQIDPPGKIYMSDRYGPLLDATGEGLKEIYRVIKRYGDINQDPYAFLLHNGLLLEFPHGERLANLFLQEGYDMQGNPTFTRIALGRIAPEAVPDWVTETDQILQAYTEAEWQQFADDENGDDADADDYDDSEEAAEGGEAETPPQQSANEASAAGAGAETADETATEAAAATPVESHANEGVSEGKGEGVAASETGEAATTDTDLAAVMAELPVTTTLDEMFKRFAVLARGGALPEAAVWTTEEDQIALAFPAALETIQAEAKPIKSALVSSGLIVPDDAGTTVHAKGTNPHLVLEGKWQETSMADLFQGWADWDLQAWADERGLAVTIPSIPHETETAHGGHQAAEPHSDHVV